MIGVTLVLIGMGITAMASGAELPAPLTAADSLAQTRPREAIAVLEHFAAEPGARALPVRRALLLRLRQAYVDLGDNAAAGRVSMQLRELGLRERDPVSLAWAQLPDIDEHLRSYRPDAAREALDRVAGGGDLPGAPDLAFSIDMAYGRAHLLKAEYEHAIERFQAGAALSDRTGHPAASRVEALMNIAYTYTGLLDHAGAYRVVTEAFQADDGRLRARTRSLLHLARALSLIDLGRPAEAEQDFARALRISRDGAMSVLEGRVLADWADLALRRERFADAERLSRAALRVAEASADNGTAITARANLGFALGGQSRLAEALGYIDQVIAHFRRQGNKQALVSMLDEKGRMLQRQGALKELVGVLREQQELERKQFTEQRSKAVAALQERFERTENQRRIELLQEQNRLKDAVIRNRELQRVVLGLAVVLMLVIGGFIGLMYRRAGKSNARLRELNGRLAEHAERDPLTGLYNRRSFVDRMQARAGGVAHERRGQARGAGDVLVVLDLDHFKQVNDTHGHGAGDAVLVEVAKRLQAVVRDSDTVLRWGGEEFVIHSAGCDAAQAAALARRILDAIAGTPVDAGGTLLRVTVSAGMIDLPFAGLDEAQCGWQQALELADGALYLAKSAGRNRCCQLLPPTGPPPPVAELERDLGAAVAAGLVGLRTILPSAPDAGAAGDAGLSYAS
ncbi:tetratricopeptide repeat-containing diguanylate cyclase [Pseudoduganella lutea]|uniref:tetratricopeptide repeat-containing diguanylate cyclase n=1 Tax=Pseudoduganella lutea TaxID=321985 RepID=UPI0013EE7B8C|nr:GGDEF domain-containing protein [Pseudoduganella lutea]